MGKHELISTPQANEILPTRSQLFEAFAEKKKGLQDTRNSLEEGRDNLKNTPGFHRTANQLILHRRDLNTANTELATADTELASFNDEWLSLGGGAIDTANEAVSNLNFNSDASDHIKAKLARRDAEDAFYENFKQQFELTQAVDENSDTTDNESHLPISTPKLNTPDDLKVGESSDGEADEDLQPLVKMPKFNTLDSIQPDKSLDVDEDQHVMSKEIVVLPETEKKGVFARMRAKFDAWRGKDKASDNTEVNKKQRQALIGIVAIAALTGSIFIAKSAIDNNNAAPLPDDKKNEQPDTGNGFGDFEDLNPDSAEQSPSAELLNSSAFVIPNGGGGEKIMRNLGLSPVEWYAGGLDRQLLADHPDVFYAHGSDVRIAKPGQLPEAVRRQIIEHINLSR